MESSKDIWKAEDLEFADIHVIVEGCISLTVLYLYVVTLHRSLTLIHPSSRSCHTVR